MSDGMTAMYKADRPAGKIDPFETKHDCPIPDQCMNCNPANIEDLVELTHNTAIVPDLDDPCQGFDLKLKGFNGTAIRLDLVESKVYLASALNRRMIVENFYANKALVIGVSGLNEGDADMYFLEVTLDGRGFQIEDVDAASGREVVLLEMVAEIASYRYLSAETIG